MSKPSWWQGAIIYQIYPRSFLDTNNNGVGDLPGITQKLDYIADLGVDGIWISPFFKSPMKDFGYDVSDYRDVDPLFGNMDDFHALLDKAHSLNLKIIVDLVLSHTSNEHPWFSDPSKKDWYVWADAKHDEHGTKQPPNNWVSVFGGKAWEWDERYQQYYLHNFLTEQPDLNFHNPEVQSEVLDTCKFWLDIGVDGIRLDVVNFYFHDQGLRDNPPREEGTKFATQFESETPYSSQQHIYDKSRPENLDFIAKLRALTNTYENRVLIGEIGDDHPYELAKLYTSGNEYLHTTYNPHMMSGTQKDLTQAIIQEPIDTFFNTENAADQHWPSWAFSNHDVVRAASRWFKLYDHNPDFSKMLIALLGCLPGNTFLYQGEELGLAEAQISYEALQDPWAKETWPEWQGRDGCRTPIPWSSDLTNCGFSTSKPWLPIPQSHRELSVQQQMEHESSTLNFTKEFLNWRKSKAEIRHGKYEFIETGNPKIIHLRRYNSKNETHCIYNVSSNKENYNGQELNAYSFKIGGFSDE